MTNIKKKSKSIEGTKFLIVISFHIGEWREWESSVSQEWSYQWMTHSTVQNSGTLIVF